jgi:hypothetical protein
MLPNHPVYKDVSKDFSEVSLKRSADTLLELVIKMNNNSKALRAEATLADAYAMNAEFDAGEAAIAYADVVFVYNQQQQITKETPK